MNNRELDEQISAEVDAASKIRMRMAKGFDRCHKIAQAPRLVEIQESKKATNPGKVTGESMMEFASKVCNRIRKMYGELQAENKALSDLRDRVDREYKRKEVNYSS